MARLGWDYPLHLGVTEAGEGEDGRMKSAIGIGALLMDGLGDTIRVSLTEDPEYEMDPCRRLAALGASSTDDELQSADRTLHNNREFWSSTGSDSPDACEALSYRLLVPARPAFVRVAVYRALYQQG